MINLNTGVIELDGIVITPKSTLKDFKKYRKKVDIDDMGNGRGTVGLVNSFSSNGINAEIEIDINEDRKYMYVYINPSIENHPKLETLEASKQWLKGIVIGEYTEDEDSLYGTYDWGYIVAQYREDRDHGIVGGEITMKYEG